MSFSNPALLKRQSAFRLPHQNSNFDDVLTPLAGNDDCPGRAIPGGNYTAASPYIDSGNTTGANDTVTWANSIFYCYYSYEASGPDHIYSFTLTGLGAHPKIDVSTTSGSYLPIVYVLDGRGGCPTGTGNSPCTMIELSYATAGIATLDSAQMKGLPLNVPLYLFVDSIRNDALRSGPYTIRMQDVTIAPAPVSNQIDSPEFFVRQHYLDFLSREPDASGLSYWKSRITECGSNALCVHDRRLDVSAAFFIEQEFQETGYFVYRFYKASLGRQPNYAEFLADRSHVVGDSDLEARKTAFANEFVGRAAFLQAYPVTMSNSEFVNKLFDTAGLASHTQEREQQLEAMTSGKTRAQVLRDVIEISEFKQREYNPAFVLTQYFGYLRRDPERSGYDFWLDVLNNRVPGNYRSMVCAFITSAEYQRRFGNDVTHSNAECAP